MKAYDGRFKSFRSATSNLRDHASAAVSGLATKELMIFNPTFAARAVNPFTTTPKGLFTRLGVPLT